MMFRVLETLPRGSLLCNLRFQISCTRVARAYVTEGLSLSLPHYMQGWSRSSRHLHMATPTWRPLQRRLEPTTFLRFIVYLFVKYHSVCRNTVMMGSPWERGLFSSIFYYFGPEYTEEQLSTGCWDHAMQHGHGFFTLYSKYFCSVNIM